MKRSVSRPAKRFILIGMMIAVLVIPAVVYLTGQPGQQDALAQAIAKLHFFPTNPPSTLTGPGSLYRVDLYGNILDTVCVADHVLVGSLSRDSLTTLVATQALREAEYSIDGGIIEKINAKLSAKRLESVRYELRGVRVLEISQENLTSINARLVQNPDCNRSVERYIRARELVCQGSSVLLASAEYSVEMKEDTKVGGAISIRDLQAVSTGLRENRIDETASVRKAMGANTATTIDGSSYRIASGQNLYYGVKLAPLCMTPQDASREWRIPRNKLERLVYWVWQISPI